MLFNSYLFLFGFLPTALIGYQLAGYFHRKAVVAWLAFMSLVFYAYWRPAFLFVLVGSIVLNYLASALISRRIPNGVSSSAWLWIAITTNLGILGFYKYLFPFLNFVDPRHHWVNVALPLGISFFTFTQIAYLVDLHQGVAKQQDIISYAVFVTFFPHLIAGPILHHKDMMPQFQRSQDGGRYRLNASDLAVGTSWLLMGLAKKVLLADYFSKTADTIFAFHAPMAPGFAWRGALCYALQLYFDFSGYSDMALGLARMFSIDFPINFDSPYKASSMIDFWKRWHITLSQYIADYVFTPLQFAVRARRRGKGLPVNRAALSTPRGFFDMIAVPTLTSMFIAGIWHGAGFQFLIYGILHGIFISINHRWNLWRQSLPEADAPKGRVTRAFWHSASVLLTFVCVLVTFIFFRAAGTAQAVSLVRSMVHAYPAAALQVPAGEVSGSSLLLKIVGGYLIVWFMPNTQQILRLCQPSIHPENVEPSSFFPRLLWSPSALWAITGAFTFILVLIRLQAPSSFLYFQF